MTWATERCTMFTGLMDVYDEDGNIVAKDKTPDNARLIAAAPDLLAALKAIPPMGEPLQPRHIVMIKQAIAKAEGGE